MFSDFANCHLFISYIHALKVSFFNRHLYEEMDNGSGVIPIQFGCIAKLHPSQASYPNRCSYISDLLDKIQIAQIIVFPYNPGYSLFIFCLFYFLT